MYNIKTKIKNIKKGTTNGNDEFLSLFARYLIQWKYKDFKDATIFNEEIILGEKTK